MTTVALIKELRELTGAGMMDCKEALEASGDSLEQAIVYLRKKGLKDISERSNKTAIEGKVGHYIHAGGQIGVLVEVNCETDFSASSEDFQTFVKDLAMHIAATNPRWLVRGDVPQDVIEQEKAIMSANLTNKPAEIVDKIVNGKLEKFYKDNCLLEQAFVKDQNLTINDLVGELGSKIGEKIVVKRFTRYALGESK